MVWERNLLNMAVLRWVVGAVSGALIFLKYGRAQIAVEIMPPVAVV
jgi:hypothetical protein